MFLGSVGLPPLAQNTLALLLRPTQAFLARPGHLKRHIATVLMRVTSQTTILVMQATSVGIPTMHRLVPGVILLMVIQDMSTVMFLAVHQQKVGYMAHKL